MSFSASLGAHLFRVVEYLKEVQENIVENVGDFLPDKEKSMPIPGLGGNAAASKTSELCSKYAGGS